MKENIVDLMEHSLFFGNYEPVLCSRKQLLKSIIKLKKGKQNETK